jgi:hypothetical protein
VLGWGRAGLAKVGLVRHSDVTLILSTPGYTVTPFSLAGVTYALLGGATSVRASG